MARDASTIYEDPARRAAGLTERILRDAIERHASDVHLQWISGGVVVRYRESGVLEEVELLPPQIGRKIISHLKVLANMNIAERRRPQDGRILYPFRERSVDLRVATVNTLYGENLTLRIFDRSSSVRRLDELGLEPADLHRVEGLIRAPHGLVLVTGPTGSGKTTTLYALLERLNTPGKNIITVEDPIEYDIERVNQISVNARLNLGFAQVLRSVFRHDPDVLMIGEIRDADSARIAVRAALSGHLVLSSLHTSSAISSFTALVQMGISPYLAASALLGVVTQQLVRRICPHCKQSFEYSSDALGPMERREFERAMESEGSPSFAVGTGCESCRQRGFSGRTGIFEILEVTGRLKELLVADAPRPRLEQAARQEGWRSLQLAGFCKILRGDTTIEEVLRVVPVAGDLDEVLGVEPDSARGHVAMP